MDKETKKIVRWPYLVTAMVSMLFAGILYAWSILKAPLGMEFGWDASQLALNFTLTMCFFCIGGIISGFALKRISLRLVLIAAAALTFMGFAGSSRCTGESPLPLYLSYGVLCGTGIGMAYNAILASVNAWFPDKKGVSSGVQMMSFGASSLLLGNLANSLMEMPQFGWRVTYLLLGAATGMILLAASLILRFPPSGTVLPAPRPAARESRQESFEPQNYTAGEMVRRFTFWRFFLFAITMAAVGNTVISLARDLSLSVGADASLAIALVGALSVCNGLGRLISGALFDSLGRRKTMIIGNAITIAAPVVILVAIQIRSVPLCASGLCLTGLSYGFSPPISAAFVMAFYGQKNFAMNFSIANTMLIPTSFVATLSGFMIASTGSYLAPFLMLIIFSIISLFLNLSIRRP